MIEVYVLTRPQSLIETFDALEDGATIEQIAGRIVLRVDTVFMLFFAPVLGALDVAGHEPDALEVTLNDSTEGRLVCR